MARNYYSGKRLNWLDTLRGLLIILMVIYHTCWDLINIFGYSIPWFQGHTGTLLQHIICYGFILIAGYSVHLSAHNLKHGLIVFIAGTLVSMVSLVFLPASPIYIGILTFIGSAVLIAFLLDRFLHKWNPIVGILLNIVLFILFQNVTRGSLGFKGFSIATLSGNLYQNYFTAYLGFPFSGFYSADYYPILPWIFLFFIGYFIYMLTKNNIAKARSSIRRFGIISFLGRHSLIIYLLHQVVIYTVLALLHMVHII